MTNNYIQFKKQRELGEIISDTFKFLRENYKALFGMIIKLVSLPFALLLLATAYYSYSLPASFFESVDFSSGNFIIAFAVLIIAYVIFYASFYATIYHFIKSYMYHQGVAVEEEVTTGFKKHFGSLIGLYIITAILIVVGLLLLIIPGVYLSIPLSLAGAVMVFKDLSIQETLKYCLQLIKDNWWMTFITIIIISLLVYVIGLIFQLPLIVYTIVKVITFAQEGSAAEMDASSDWVMIVLQVFSSLIQHLLSVITVIALAFIYFNLNEEKHLTGTFEKIESIGQ